MDGDRRRSRGRQRQLRHASGAAGRRIAYAPHFGNDDGFWGATRLHASAGQGIKEPTFEQSFEDDPCYPGNPNLSPERSTTYNAGVEQVLAGDRIRMNVDYFHNLFYDIVSFSGGPPTINCPYGTGTFFNTDKARAYGTNIRWKRSRCDG